MGELAALVPMYLPQLVTASASTARDREQVPVATAKAVETATLASWTHEAVCLSGPCSAPPHSHSHALWGELAHIARYL